MPGPGRRSWLLALLCVVACKPEAAETAPPTGLAAGATRVTIEPAPEHLRGRVALATGARVYARPTFTSPSWAIALPDPPLSSGDGPPRSRAFRTVGIVRANDGTIGGAGDFVAITNDLEGEDGDAPIGCGSRFHDLGHLRMLLYVPVIHLAQVTTRVLELEAHSTRSQPDQLRLGAGVRVGAIEQLQGLPPIADGSSWRWVDADGIRVLAPIPDDAVGVAWDPGLLPKFGDAGEALFRDAEGSVLWLRDDGGETVELTVRNACAEQRSQIDDAKEVEGLRALALDAFYDQRPEPEPEPAVEPEADYRIPVGTALRWTDGDLAGETLADWSVAIGVGQTWDGRRCFPLPLGGELSPVDSIALTCVDPKSLQLLAGSGFGASDELELGGSVVLGPAAELDGGPWDPQSLRAILNGRHDSVAECLRPLLMTSEGLTGSRWDLRLTITLLGRVDEVELVARGASHEAVEDCLRAEAFTWLFPDGAGGRIEVPVTLGQWTAAHDSSEPEPEPEPGEGKRGEGKQDQPERERGKVIIIRDDEDEQ
ncbi:MAG TPA: hypothetical protein VK034_02665 [Enhygromyxa sp.]|nr:hypothetical protein [Enhygromyxa sp.]